MYWLTTSVVPEVLLMYRGLMIHFIFAKLKLCLEVFGKSREVHTFSASSTAMKTYPKIIVKKDIPRDKSLFLDFLHSDFFRESRNIILDAYPKLKSKLRSAETKKEIEINVDGFVEELYATHERDINKILQREKKVFIKYSDRIFSTLAEIMNHKWDPSFKYYAIPTFLPFAPYGKNFFCFSIYSELIQKKNPGRNELVAIHELSHFVWLEKIKRVYEHLGYSLNKDAHHDLKEIFAPIIMRDERFRGITLGRGRPNRYLKLLYVKRDNEKQNILDFFEELYKKGKREGLAFEEIMEKVVMVTSKIQDELSKRKEILRKYGPELENLKLRGYDMPIKIGEK